MSKIINIFVLSCLSPLRKLYRKKTNYTAISKINIIWHAGRVSRRSAMPAVWQTKAAAATAQLTSVVTLSKAQDLQLFRSSTNNNSGMGIINRASKVIYPNAAVLF